MYAIIKFASIIQLSIFQVYFLFGNSKDTGPNIKIGFGKWVNLIK